MIARKGAVKLDGYADEVNGLNAAPTPIRLRGLDGLRAVAVSLVVWHNFGRIPGTARWGSLGTMRAGYVGVTLFFVLSGFLITHRLLDEIASSGNIGFRAFYLRRAARLFPALALTLVVLVGLNAARQHPWPDTGAALGSAAAYVFNFAALHANPKRPLGGPGWGHLWSLAVEEQFYFVWPVILVGAAKRMTGRHLVRVLIGVALVITAWRTLLWRHGASFSRLYLATDVRFDALVLGAALAAGFRTWPQHRQFVKRFGWLMLPLLLAILLLGNRGSSADSLARPGWLIGPGMTGVSLVSVALVWIAADEAGGLVGRLLDSPIAMAIGRRSYGIYLFHFPALAVATDHGGWLVALGLTAVLTEGSYRLIERPAVRCVPAWAK